MGWHPFCRCIAVAKLADEDEFIARAKARINGDEDVTEGGYSGEVTEMPQAFTDWMQNNADRLETANTVPYFVRDNAQLIAAAQAPKNSIAKNAKLPFAVGEPWQPSISTNNPQKEFVTDLLKDCAKQQQIASEELKKLQDNGCKVFEIDNISQKTWRKLSPEQRFDAIIARLDSHHGEGSEWHSQIRDAYLDYKDLVGVEKALKHLRDNWALPAKSEMYNARTHLKEIVDADLSVIPSKWQKEFAKALARINQADKETVVFEGVYYDLEHAYNILKLSTDPQVKKFGFEKVSTKMPYQLLTVYQEKIPELKLGTRIPPKEFWDSLKEFVPLVNTGESGAYHSPVYKIVHISLSDADIKRLNASRWYQTNLLHHEYGHAMDHQFGLSQNEDTKKVFEEFKKLVSENEVIFTKALAVKVDANLRLRKMLITRATNNFIDKISSLEYQTGHRDVKKLGKASDRLEKWIINRKEDIDERLGGYSDTLQAVTKKHETLAPRMHSKSYFAEEENQLKEFIAHASENYWGGNDMFKKLAPELYEKMQELIRKHIDARFRSL